MRDQGAIRARSFATVISTLLLSGSGAVTAQAPPRPSERTFSERVEVRVVNLEAVVVDRRGQRVPGLSAEDFALEVDGRPMPLGFFSEITDGVAVTTGDQPEAESPVAAPDAAAPGQRVPTSYLVFIDSYFTRFAGRRNRIVQQIEDNLGRLGPGDRMAIVAFNGRKLSVLSSWSQSADHLRSALADARDLPARGFITGNLADELDRSLEAEEELSSISAQEDSAAGDGADTTSVIRGDGLPTEICSTIERLERRIGRAVTGVTASLRGFSQPPGRKVMMLLSGGWPHSAKDYLVGSRPFGAIDCPNEGAAIYRPIYETANRLGYTLYPVDIPLREGGVVTADDDGQRFFEAGGASAGFVDGASQFTRAFEVHSTLYKLAEETGGTAMVDGAAESAFDRMIDDTRTYYWLGFTPPWKGDDKSHKVRLEVLRPGLEVRNRRGYLDQSLKAEISNVTESALLLGDLPGAHSLGLAIGAMPRKGRARLTLPLQLTIPMDAITMTARKGGFAAELELRVAVVDDGGNRNELPVIPVTLGGPELPPRGAHAVYETAIKIRRRPHDIVVSLYDPLSDTILAATGSIAPGGPADRAK